MGRKLGLWFVLVALLMVAVPPAASSREEAMEKLHWWVLDHTQGGAKSEFFVIMKDQADVSLARELPTKLEKGWFVYQALTDKAERTQAPIRALLDARGIGYRVYFIVNAVFVEGGTRELALELAQRDDVDRIEGNPVIQNFFPDIESAEDPGPRAPEPCDATGRGPEAITAVEWGVTRVNAPGVWAIGHKGEGIVVGAQDTGYRWTHTFVKNQYRGWDGTTADHNYNWHDSVHSGGVGGTCTGPDMLFPCDDHGHGTHTISTVLGDDGGSNQTGVAPQAKWIGCRDMNLGAGTPATYLECFQFFLAPTMLNGTNPDPSKAPDLTTNSWGCPTSEGCSWTTLQTAVDNQKAAGIMTVVAAGNSGSSCNTVTDPPAMYLTAYTVGSTTSSDTMSSFSSRGVGTGNGAMKPDIVAPGSSIRGATNTSDTATMTISGTSMATPHVAGCVALLWSAKPCLKRQQDSTATQLNASATRLPSIVESCGGNYVTGPNNTWGYGLVNALSAVNTYTWEGLPTIGTATVPGLNQIAVSWTAGTPAATTYNIYRSTGACPGGTFTLVKSGQASSPWTDTTVSGGTTYSYEVSGVDATGGCESALSGCVSATATGTCSAAPTFAGIASVTNPAGATCTLNLGWVAGVSNCSGTVSYRIYRSAVAPFTPAPVNRIATGQTGTVYSDAAGLASGTTYYYIVRAVDSANGSEDTNTVTLSGIPTGPMAPGTFTAGAETGDPAMTMNAPWVTSTTYKRSGTNSYSTGVTYPTSACGALVTPPIILGTSPVLTFYHIYSTEAGYDGGRVEISTSGGSSWTALTPTPAYSGTITSTGNACGWPTATACYIGNSTGYPTTWQLATVSLSAYNGQTVLLRWNFTTDGSLGGSMANPGWYIDDIAITNVQVPGTCTTGGGTPPPEIGPGTGGIGTAMTWAGSSLTWPAEPTATSYTVYRGLKADLPLLLGPSTNCCTRYAGALNQTGNITEDPGVPAGRFYWYLVTGWNASGQGPAGGGKIMNSSGVCP